MAQSSDIDFTSVETRTPATVTLAQRWCALQVLHDRISSQLERALQQDHGISVREFSLLEILDRQHPGDNGHFQMKELASSIALSQSATTRLVTRLEEQGLLERYICPTDRRGIYTHLTNRGRETLVAARPTNDAALQHTLDDLVNDSGLAPFVLTLKDELST